MSFVYYGWNVGTTLGYLPRYDNELNLPASLLPNSFVAVSDPTLSMQAAGNALLIFPLVNTLGLIKTIDGSEVTALPVGEISPSVWVMDAVDEASVPADATIGVVMIGALPIVAILVCVAICAIAAAVIFVGQYFTSAWVQAEYYQAQEAYYDYLVQAMQVISDESVDLNGDGIPDVRYITWANGRAVSWALSDYGVSVLGSSYVLDDEGETAEAPAEPDLPMDINTMLVIIACVVGGVIVLSMLMGKGSGSGTPIILGR